jgi:glucose/arabinose dehydrogenase/mono/diheme cytochrome c family protein
MKQLGFIATIAIGVLLGFNMLREPNRQQRQTDEQRDVAVETAMQLYGLHCVECHGPSGQGLNLNPALNDRNVRTKDAEELYKTISRGRRNTAMVGFSVEENGMLTTPQIDSLVTMIRYGAWGHILRYIETEGLSPAEAPPIQVQFDVEALTYPLEVVTEGRDLFLAYCQSCHNIGTSVVTGHNIGKALVDNEFVQDSTEEELLEFVRQGRAEDDPENITGYEMPPRGGNPDMTDEEILATIAYMKELNSDAVIFSEAAVSANPRGTWDGLEYEWVPVVDNFDSPILVMHAGDGSGRLFVAEQTGVILVVEDGEVTPEPFLDITRLLPLEVYSGIYTERGLLGLAFHPDYEENGIFYISYINREFNSVLARYRVSPDDPNRADPDSGEIILTVEQPFEDHNGGNIVFGPDGYLYIGFGDGGRPADPNYNSQDPAKLLGKMLRLDVDSGDPYAIPPDNPFVDDPAFRPEIWALGLRNPWRFTFDRATGDMYIGDVGQWLYEELDFQPGDSEGGENYGWSAFEANHVYLEDETVLGGVHTPPILEYGHEIGLSITGGYVYRGEDLPGLQGMYIYGDYVNGFVWILHRDEDGVWQNEVFMETGFVISSFGEDEAGELYLVDYKGTIYRLAQVAPETK